MSYDKSHQALVNRSYVASANQRIDNLESLIKARLLDGGQRVAGVSINSSSFLEYLFAVRKELQTNPYNQSISDVKRKRNRKRQHFSSQTETSSLNYADPAQSEYLGPIRVGSYKLSDILESSIQLYCTRLDPQAFWLNGTELGRLIRSPCPSLLKSLFLDSCLNISFLNKREKEHINPHRVSELLPIAYNNPSLDNLLGLIFLSLDCLIDRTIQASALYMASAFRMADALNIINGDVQHSISASLPSEAAYNIKKNRIRELLILVHIALSPHTINGPIVSWRSVCEAELDHIEGHEIPLPTFSRALDSSSFPLSSHNSTKDNCEPSAPFCRKLLLSPKPKGFSATKLKMHSNILRIMFTIHQDVLIYDSDTTHQYSLLTEDDRTRIGVELREIIAQLPSTHKIPAVATRAFNYSESSTRLNYLCRVSLLDRSFYTSTLACLAYVEYPISWLRIPRPMSLSEASFDSLIETSNLIYHYFITQFTLFHDHPEPNTIVALNLPDVTIPAFAYLNALLHHPNLNPKYRIIYPRRVQNIIDELNFLKEWSEFGDPLSATSTLNVISKALPNFQELPADLLPNI